MCVCVYITYKHLRHTCIYKYIHTFNIHTYSINHFFPVKVRQGTQPSLFTINYSGSGWQLQTV